MENSASDFKTLIQFYEVKLRIIRFTHTMTISVLNKYSEGVDHILTNLANQRLAKAFTQTKNIAHRVVLLCWMLRSSMGYEKFLL